MSPSKTNRFRVSSYQKSGILSKFLKFSTICSFTWFVLSLNVQEYRYIPFTARRSFKGLMGIAPKTDIQVLTICSLLASSQPPLPSQRLRPPPSCHCSTMIRHDQRQSHLFHGSLLIVYPLQKCRIHDDRKLTDAGVITVSPLHFDHS